MHEQLTFEAGKFYRLANGYKALMVAVRPRYLIVEIEGIGTKYHEYCPDGYPDSSPIGSNDWQIVAEWTEPRRWRVGIYSSSGKARLGFTSVEYCAFLDKETARADSSSWRLVASVEALEGQFIEDAAEANAADWPPEKNS